MVLPHATFAERRATLTLVAQRRLRKREIEYAKPFVFLQSVGQYLMQIKMVLAQLSAVVATGYFPDAT